jgi:dephospho-CoA kinase
MPPWKYNRPKPVIGLTGGIGSGKSFIAQLFQSQGCAVIDSDRLSHDILQSPAVKAEIRAWLGPAPFNADGSVNRKSLAGLVFQNVEKTSRLNSLIHPRVAQAREALMENYLADPGILAVIWDSPLLIEAGLNRDCDMVIFVKVPSDIRLERISGSRGWSAEELAKREKLQIPLDNKAQLADYCLDNSGDEASSLRQVQRVLSQLSAASR